MAWEYSRGPEITEGQLDVLKGENPGWSTVSESRKEWVAAPDYKWPPPPGATDPDTRLVTVTEITIYALSIWGDPYNRAFAQREHVYKYYFDPTWYFHWRKSENISDEEHIYRLDASSQPTTNEDESKARQDTQAFANDSRSGEVADKSTDGTSDFDYADGWGANKGGVGDKDGVGGVSVRPTTVSISWPITQTVAQAFSPVPIIFGEHVIGGNILWVANPRTEQGPGETFAVRYIYDIGLCMGPVDNLLSIQVGDGEIIEVNATRGTAEYVDVSIGGTDAIRFYWGTATQPVDATIAATKSVGDYTRYPYVCHAVVQVSVTTDAQQRARVPDIKFVVRRTPDTGLAFTHSINGGCNPVAIVYDLLTSPFYEEAFANTDLNLPTFLAAGLVLAAEGFGLHLLYASGADVSEAVLAVLDYCGAYLRNNGETYDFILDRGGYVVASLPAITAANASRADPKFKSMSNIINEVTATFNDDGNAGKIARIYSRDTGGQDSLGYRKPCSISLPGVRNLAVAARMVYQYLKEVAYPAAQASYDVSGALLRTLPGDKVRVTASDVAFADRPCLVTQTVFAPYPFESIRHAVTEDVRQVVDDKYIEAADRSRADEGGGGWLKTGHVAISPAQQAEQGVTFAQMRVFELPHLDEETILDESSALAVAVAKPAPHTAVGYSLYMSIAGDNTTDYRLVGVVREFASCAELDGVYPPDRYTWQDGRGRIDRLGMPISPFVAYDMRFYSEIAEYVDVITRKHPAWVDGEWMSLGRILERATAGQFMAWLVGRRWFDGYTAVHADATEVWILKRGLFGLDQHFKLGDVLWFRAVPFDLRHELNLADAVGLQYTVTGVRHKPYQPISLRANDTGAYGSPVYSPGGDVMLTWRNRSRGQGVRYQDLYRLLGNTLAHTDGTIEIDVLDVGNNIKGGVTGLGTATWLYTNAMMLADFGGEPALIKFRLYGKDVAAGEVPAYRSSAYEEIVVKKNWV